MRRSGSTLAFAALRHPSFRLFTLAGMLWMMADNTEHVISYWVIFEEFHSPLLGGYAVISHWAPFLLLGVYMGALADRFDCRKLCIISMSLFMAVSLAWGYLFLTDSIQVWHAVILLTVHGLAGAMFMPASQLIVHDIVGNEQLQSAVRLTATSRQLGILLGPAVGGLLLLSVGPGLGMLLNALVYLPMVWWSLREPYTGHRREQAGRPPAMRLGLDAALRVIKEASGNRTILTMIALVGLSSLLVGNAHQAQMPEFAKSFLTDNEGLTYSMLLAANAAGAVFGGLALEMVGRLDPSPRKATLLAALWAVCMVLFAAATHYVLALVALFAAGILQIGFTSMATTLVQLEAPAARRGQIMGVFNMSLNGLRMGSGITVGFLGALVGIHWSLGLSGSILCLTMIALLLFVRSRHAAIAPAGKPMTLAPTDHADGGCC